MSFLAKYCVATTQACIINTYSSLGVIKVCQRKDLIFWVIGSNKCCSKIRPTVNRYVVMIVSMHAPGYDRTLHSTCCTDRQTDRQTDSAVTDSSTKQLSPALMYTLCNTVCQIMPQQKAVSLCHTQHGTKPISPIRTPAHTALRHSTCTILSLSSSSQLHRIP